MMKYTRQNIEIMLKFLQCTCSSNSKYAVLIWYF